MSVFLRLVLGNCKCRLAAVQPLNRGVDAGCALLRRVERVAPVPPRGEEAAGELQCVRYPIQHRLLPDRAGCTPHITRKSVVATSATSTP
jgi:hypothetical protein